MGQLEQPIVPFRNQPIIRYLRLAQPSGSIINTSRSLKNCRDLQEKLNMNANGGSPGSIPQDESYAAYLRHSCYELLFGSKMNILLVFFPLAIISEYVGWSDGCTFIFSLLALAPLAERLGYVTEQLSLHTNKTVGGLMNATFGNLTEMIVSVVALKNGYYRLVQLSLLGSILSNLLLVLGSAFFIGGLRVEEQRFNTLIGKSNGGMLLVASMSVLFPAALDLSGESKSSDDSEIVYSRFASLVLIVMYLGYLAFQLITHAHYFDEDAPVLDAPPMSASSRRSRTSNPGPADGRPSSVSSPKMATPKLLANGGGGTGSQRRTSNGGKGGRAVDDIVSNPLLPSDSMDTDGQTADAELQDMERGSRGGSTGGSGVGNGNGSSSSPPAYERADTDEIDDSKPGSTSNFLSDQSHGNIAGPPTMATNARANSSNNNNSSGDSATGAAAAVAAPTGAGAAAAGSSLRSRGGHPAPLPISEASQLDHVDRYEERERHDNDDDNDDEDDEEEAVLGLWGSIFWLAVFAVLISLLSDYIVDTVEATAEQFDISSVFIASIVIPIVGNAAEHSSAIVFAYKNKLDITIGIAVGSGTQIALFVIPFCVLLGWAIDRDLSLYFHGYETACCIITVLVVTYLIQDGKSNWLIGMCLIGAYLVVAAGFCVHLDEDLASSET